MNRKLYVSAAGVTAITILAIAGCKTSSVQIADTQTIITAENSIGFETSTPTPSQAPAIQTELKPEQEAEVVQTSGIIASRDWGADDAYLLEKIAMAEAEGEDTEGKALVMLVVLNRVWSDEFPGTIHDVIYEDGQFTPIDNGRFDAVEPDEDCRKAMDLITKGQWDESDGALYFESAGGDNWHSRNLEFLFQHGNHYFYR